MLNHPGAIRMILLHGKSFSFATTLLSKATSAKAWASRPFQGRLSSSTAQAKDAGTGEAN